MAPMGLLTSWQMPAAICPKEAIFLTDRIVNVEDNRGSFIYGKDKLVEPRDERIDVSKRQVWSFAQEGGE